MILTETKLTTVGSKKAAEPQRLNAVTFQTTGKRKDFDLVISGTCPHDGARLGDEIRGRGAGVSRICEKCGHRWYLLRRIKRTRCLTCFAEQRRNNRNKSRNRTLDAPTVNSYNYLKSAGMAELADAADLKF